MQEQPFERHGFKDLIATLKDPKQVLNHGLYDNLAARFSFPPPHLEKIARVLVQAERMAMPGKGRKIRGTLRIAPAVRFDQSITHGIAFQNGLIPAQGAMVIWMHRIPEDGTFDLNVAAAKAGEFAHVARLIQKAGLHAVVLANAEVDGKLHAWHINPPQTTAKPASSKRRR